MLWKIIRGIQGRGGGGVLPEKVNHWAEIQVELGSGWVFQVTGTDAEVSLPGRGNDVYRSPKVRGST